MTRARTVHAVVLMVGAVTLIAIGGAIVLALSDHQVPDAIGNTISVGIVGLVGLLATPRGSEDEPTPVEVVAPDPLPVEPAADDSDDPLLDDVDV